MPEHHNTIFTGDFHLTEREADEYRWSIFPWLVKRIEHYKIDYLFILGDLTDQKDDHSAKLVHRIHQSLKMLASTRLRLTVLLKGNHDYHKNERIPYFGYLHRSYRGKVFYLTQPTPLGLFQKRYLFLPHTRNWHEAYGNGRFDLGDYDRVFIHQRVKGCKAESGQTIDDGLSIKALRKARSVIGADVHVPQTYRNLTYCGAPHPVHFGDTFQPRVLLEKEGEMRSIMRTTIKKQVVSVYSSKQFKAAGFSQGDQVRVEVTLPRIDFDRWNTIKGKIGDYCKRQGIELKGIFLTERPDRPAVNADLPQGNTQVTKPAEVLVKYGADKGITDELVKVGLRIIKRS